MIIPALPSDVSGVAVLACGPETERRGPVRPVYVDIEGSRGGLSTPARGRTREDMRTREEAARSRPRGQTIASPQQSRELMPEEHVHRVPQGHGPGGRMHHMARRSRGEEHRALRRLPGAGTRADPCGGAAHVKITALVRSTRRSAGWTRCRRRDRGEILRWMSTRRPLREASTRHGEPGPWTRWER